MVGDLVLKVGRAMGLEREGLAGSNGAGRINGLLGLRNLQVRAAQKGVYSYKDRRMNGCGAVDMDTCRLRYVFGSRSVATTG